MDDTAAEALLEETATDVISNDPPPGLSAAALRSWKRRQKILSRGEAGIERITGVRDSVAKASTAEVKGNEKNKATEIESGPETGARTEGTEEAAEAPVETTDKDVPSWEARWTKAAEKTETRELNFDKPAPVQVPKSDEGSEGSGVTSTNEVRQRKGAPPRTPASPKATGPQDEDDSATLDLASKLREKLHVERWQRREWVLRQILIVGGAVVSCFWLVENGGFVDQTEIYGKQIDAADTAQDPALSDDSFGSDETFELKLDGEGAGRASDANTLEGMASQMMLHFVEPPMMGWVSLPIGLLLLRIVLAAVLSTVGGYPFSVSPPKGSGASSLPFPFGLVAGLASSNPAIGSAFSLVAIGKAVMDDMILVMVIVVTGLALFKLTL
eukprot:CAMPEP_0184549686 /NCGR_PEP_ID=MMETSP0199_2-20130426/11809_1 /TAXON_ID=1112570 /ORGANISM="Thraustochytrium sp., Strain LLF1b" /LENGTH=385 /DNA_ID=CAMNT_0026944429 /DNA_START=45 /DNA_END=1202 /DNA_ORIENTATION=-